MVKIIETNLSLNSVDEIMDHQSRVVEVESWSSYVEEIKNAKSINRSDKVGSLHGYSLPKDAEIQNLIYDDFHLSCNVIRGSIRGKKLVYKCL